VGLGLYKVWTHYKLDQHTSNSNNVFYFDVLLTVTLSVFISVIN